jgi:sugar/nucleoside kinase (ribokinase family)
MTAILGMGNALVDILVTLPNDDLLQQFNLPKGSMQLVDREFSQKVLDGTANLPKAFASGGSAANTIHGLAGLGVATAFLGEVGQDEYGKFFHKDLESDNIKPILLQSTTESGRVVALISPDSERTFATYLGAAVELSHEGIHADQFEGYGVFHIEGYLVYNHDLMLTAMKMAKAKGLRISLDLASYNVVEANLDFLRDVLKEYVDIVFANEEEAKAFTGKSPEESLDELAAICDIAVVKVGSKGSFVKRGQEKHSIGVIPANSIDTTGAGDLYAAGFLFGLVNDKPLDQCGEIGALLAGTVIQGIGAKIGEAGWKSIREKLKMM